MKRAILAAAQEGSGVAGIAAMRGCTASTGLMLRSGRVDRRLDPSAPSHG